MSPKDETHHRSLDDIVTDEARHVAKFRTQHAICDRCESNGVRDWTKCEHGEWTPRRALDCMILTWQEALKDDPADLGIKGLLEAGYRVRGKV